MAVAPMYFFRLYPDTHMEFLQQNIFWAALVVISGGLYLWNLTRADGSGVTPQAAVNLINRENALLVDVREGPAYAHSHVGGARSIPLAQLETRLADLEKSKAVPIIVYGGDKEVSRAIKLLRSNGFPRAVGLQGGLEAWSAAGMPVDR